MSARSTPRARQKAAAACSTASGAAARGGVARRRQGPEVEKAPQHTTTPQPLPPPRRRRRAANRELCIVRAAMCCVAWRVRTLFFASLSAPRPSSSVTTDARPMRAALCSGASPLCAHNGKGTQRARMPPPRLLTSRQLASRGAAQRLVRGRGAVATRMLAPRLCLCTVCPRRRPAQRDTPPRRRSVPHAAALRPLPRPWRHAACPRAPKGTQ
jgi:hypothetical protein